jgi:hypothetical protein
MQFLRDLEKSEPWQHDGSLFTTWQEERIKSNAATPGIRTQPDDLRLHPAWTAQINDQQTRRRAGR